MKITVYYAPSNDRSRIIARAMERGIDAAGDIPALKSSLAYRQPDSDVAIFYGLVGGLQRVLADYRRSGRKAVYVDLGYWQRRKATRFDGYHKLSVNDRHPTAYFQREPHRADRLDRLALDIRPWRTEGREIIVAGMSAKAAAAEGLPAELWERRTIAALRRLSPRPIIYRPKPNWHGARPIEGSIMQRGVALESALASAHAVVTHHSNVAVDAIMAGVPVICEQGVASPMASSRLEDIENPPRPDGRAQWAADIAYCQWTIAEMESGAAWRYLSADALL